MNIIGFDVSKDTIDCNLLINGKTNYHVKHDNNENGFKKIHDFIKQNKIRKVSVVMEATGIYYENAANYFVEYYDVYVVNPLKIKRHAQKTFSRTKTDKADAKMIADYGSRFLDKLIKYHKPTEIQYALKNFNLLIRQLKEEIKRHKNQIHSSKLEYVINSHLEIIESIDKKIKETEEEILKLVEQSELKQHFDNLLTIPCIGTQTALQILTVLCSKHFVTANRFIAYAGLSPSIFESGTSVKKPDKLSRLGNLQLKSSLFMPALGAMRTHYFKDFVDRLESNGKQRKVIVGALMRKLLKLAYYIYMTNKPFNPNYKY